jgi:hypothetical protein
MQAVIVGSDVSALKAREAFIAYRNLVREGRATEDDELLMRAYKTIAQGKRVLDLRETLKLGGLDAQLRPRLAIARADTVHVHFRYSYNLSRWAYMNNPRASGRLPLSAGLAIPVPTSVYPQIQNGQRWDNAAKANVPGWNDLRAAVPTIPAHLRPATSALSGLHILWEAEWEPVAPRDPILLKRIGAYLYAVLAQWDLTELERAVLGARLS